MTMKERKRFSGISVFGKKDGGEILITRYGDVVNVSFTKRGDERKDEISNGKNCIEILFYSKSTDCKKLRKRIRTILKKYKSKNYNYIISDDVVLAALKKCSDGILYPIVGSLANKLK